MTSYLEELMRANELKKPLERERGSKKPSKRPQKGRRRKKEVYVRQDSLSEEKRAQRRAEWRRDDSSLVGSWKMYRRYMMQRARIFEAKGWHLDGATFDISKEEWCLLWLAAGQVWHRGQTKPAIQARGPRKDDVKLCRHDSFAPFTLSNVGIWLNGNCLVDGSKLNAS